MTEEHITHKTLADLVGVSETTIKSYRRKFPGCIPVSSQGKPIRFTPEAKEVVTRIHGYFSLGMSVEEVRSRLEGEFSFISPAPKKEQPAKERPDMAPEITQGMSNMAKSLVSMTGQQKTILQRVEGIEHILESMGVSDLRLSEEAYKKRQEEAKDRQVKLESRLDDLDVTTKELSHAVAAIAQGLRHFLEQQQKIQAYSLQQQEQQAAATVQAPAQAAVAAAEQERYETQSPTFPAPAAQDYRAVASSFTTEPDRAVYQYPLVAKREDGKYISAGGRNRGRFCLNDLKAMTVYGFATPNQFSMQWHPHNGNWWLLLEQPGQEAGTTLHMLLVELATQRGSVMEIMQLVYNGQPVHPAAICSIIDTLVEQYAT